MGQNSSRSNPPERRAARQTSRVRAASGAGDNGDLGATQRRRSLLFSSSRSTSSSSHTHDQAGGRGTGPRRRLRFHRSFTSTIPNVFTREASLPTPPSTRSSVRQARPIQPSTALTDTPPSHALPPLQPLSNLDLAFGEPTTNSEQFSETQPRNQHGTRNNGSSVTDRFHPQSPERGFRNLTAALRRRRTNINRGDDHAAILARLLSMTAAATAASLMGINPDNAVGDFQDTTGVVDDDGTFDGFLQALRGGRLGDALGRSEGIPGVETNAPDNAAPSLDFFRMFRFGSSAQSRRDQQMLARPPNNSGGTTVVEDTANPENASGGDRMIPVLIVGIRSLNPDRDETDQADNMPSFLDALSNMPNPMNSGGTEGTSSTLRQPRTPIGLGHRRRASMGGFNLFSANRDSSRRSSRPQDLSNPRTDYRTSIQETPPGPFPPPTTPSSPPVSALSSGVSTPNGRISPSISSAFGASRSRRESLSASSGLPATVEEEPTPRTRPSRRRMSESDFGAFGAGSSRRNGAYLEPLDSNPQPGEGSRSWIIYILGGNYPENHPILTAPTLFSDNPTYEDMLLLSSLLGPVKPPVASQQDLAAAGGMFKIQQVDHVLAAVAVDHEQNFVMNPGERCLVCLCEYEINDDARRLAKCGHLFHRECIDQWLTTGRNSCPLCRGQGVDEQEPQGAATSEAGPSNLRPGPI